MSPLHSHKSRSSTGSLSRANSTRAAIRRGDLKISEPIPIPREGIDGFGPQAGVGSPNFYSSTSVRNPKTRSARTRDSEGEIQEQIIHPSQSVKKRPPDYNPQGPSNLPQTTGSLSANPHDSMSTTYSKSSQKKKRKDSTLRGVMRRLFGSKTREEERKPPFGNHHRSDPGRLQGRAGPPRSSSMPISEVTRASALGSHSPLAAVFDFNNDPAPPTVDPEPSGHRRRATLPSIVFSQSETRNLAASLSKSCQIVDRNGTTSDGYESALGYVQTINSKRRSRSASGLREASIRDHQMSPIQWRRRSDEIKFWRNSILEQPIPVFATSRPQTANILEQDRSEETPIQQPPSPERYSQDTPFDFGPLIGTIQNTEAATLEQRMTTLEVKAIDLEYAVAKLQERQQPLGGSTPDVRGSVIRGNAQKNRGPPTFLTSPARSIVEDSPERPTSMANTIRARTAVNWFAPSTPNHPPAEETDLATQTPIEIHRALISLIKAEESARKELELRVLRLQKELQELRSTTRTEGGGYPTPSPEIHDPPPPPRGRHAPSASVARTEDSDTDEGFMDVYETPAEAREYRFGVESANRQQQMVGMI